MQLQHRIASLLTALLFFTLSAQAQRQTLTGRIVDKESGDALAKTTIQLYKIGKSDTTFVSGVYSDNGGRFTFSGGGQGSYLLKATYLGYKMVARNVAVDSRRGLALGDIAMEADAVQLQEAVVTANIPKMIIKDDTVVYNADAFRVPEGSVN